LLYSATDGYSSSILLLSVLLLLVAGKMLSLSVKNELFESKLATLALLLLFVGSWIILLAWFFSFCKLLVGSCCC
jgi:hypothetical protein